MIVAMFADEASLEHALQRLRAARIGPVETYTPAPLKEAETGSPIPLIVLLAGLFGAAASFGLQTWSFTVAYPFRIGGRPEFAWPSFIPTVFENAVLIAIVTGFVAFMIINRLPQLYDPVDEADCIRRASSDGWCVAIRSKEPGLIRQARDLLRALPTTRIEELSQ